MDELDDFFDFIPDTCSSPSNYKSLHSYSPKQNRTRTRTRISLRRTHVSALREPPSLSRQPANAHLVFSPTVSPRYFERGYTMSTMSSATTNTEKYSGGVNIPDNTSAAKEVQQPRPKEQQSQQPNDIPPFPVPNPLGEGWSPYGMNKGRRSALYPDGPMLQVGEALRRAG